METPIELPGTLGNSWAPRPHQISTETIAVLADVPPLPICRAAALVDGDELVCGEAPVADLSPDQALALHRAAMAINAVQRGQLWGSLMLIARIREDVLLDALQALGWPLPSQELPTATARSQRKAKPESAASGESAEPAASPPASKADREEVQAAILRIVEDLSADPQGALDLLESERKAIGSVALARTMGLPTNQALNAVCRRLRGMLPAADPTAQLVQRFSDPGRRRWLLRQMADAVLAGLDPVAEVVEQTGLSRAAAAAVLAQLEITVQ